MGPLERSMKWVVGESESERSPWVSESGGLVSFLNIQIPIYWHKAWAAARARGLLQYILSFLPSVHPRPYAPRFGSFTMPRPQRTFRLPFHLPFPCQTRNAIIITTKFRIQFFVYFDSPKHANNDSNSCIRLAFGSLEFTIEETITLTNKLERSGGHVINQIMILIKLWF
jgi:hypothetical protein